MCGHIPKNGVLGAGTPPKRGVLGTCTVRKVGSYRNFSCKKRGSEELKLHKKGLLGAYLSHIFTFTCQYNLQTKKRGLRNGHNQKKRGS